MQQLKTKLLKRNRDISVIKDSHYSLSMKTLLLAYGGTTPSHTQFTPSVVGQMPPEVLVFLEANKNFICVNPWITKFLN